MDTDIIVDTVGVGSCIVQAILAAFSGRCGRIFLFTLKLLGIALDVLSLYLLSEDGKTTAVTLYALVFSASLLPMIIVICARCCMTNPMHDETKQSVLDLSIKPPPHYYEKAFCKMTDDEDKFTQYQLDTLWYGSLFRFEDFILKAAKYLDPDEVWNSHWTNCPKIWLNVLRIGAPMIYHMFTWGMMYLIVSLVTEVLQIVYLLLFWQFCTIK